MKIATWNVNGIRARHGQLLHWIDREQPDVICLQEIKASPTNCRCAVRDRGLLVLLARRRGLLRRRRSTAARSAGEGPRSSHPGFDLENAHRDRRGGDIMFASSTCRTAARTFAAKMRFLRSWAWAAGITPRGAPLVMCGDLNVARTELRRAPEGAEARPIGQRPRSVS